MAASFPKKAEKKLSGRICISHMIDVVQLHRVGEESKIYESPFNNWTNEVLVDVKANGICGVDLTTAMTFSLLEATNNT
jgi:hypothetical protein